MSGWWANHLPEAELLGSPLKSRESRSRSLLFKGRLLLGPPVEEEDPELDALLSGLLLRLPPGPLSLPLPPDPLASPCWCMPLLLLLPDSRFPWLVPSCSPLPNCLKPGPPWGGLAAP